jgi:hypothetical protein
MDASIEFLPGIMSLSVEYNRLGEQISEYVSLFGGGGEMLQSDDVISEVCCVIGSYILLGTFIFGFSFLFM